MLIAFVADNEHGRSLIALIRAIRACPACAPAAYALCATHRAELDRLYPEQCPDADCPACTADDAPPAGRPARHAAVQLDRAPGKYEKAASGCKCDHGPECPCSLPPGAHHFYPHRRG